MALRRAGLLSGERFASELEEVLSRARYAERAASSLEDLAKEAFSSPSALSADPDAYYAAGHAVSLALIAELLDHSGGKVGLEQLLAALLPRPGAPPLVIDTAALGRIVDGLVPATPPLSAALAQWVQAPVSFGSLLPSLDRIGLHVKTSTELEPDFGLAVGGEPPQVQAVVSGEAYARAGGQVGDRLLRIDGKPYRGASAWPSPTAELRLEIERNGATRTLVLRPRMVPSTNVKVDARALQRGNARLQRLLGELR